MNKWEYNKERTRVTSTRARKVLVLRAPLPTSFTAFLALNVLNVYLTDLLNTFVP